MIKYGCRGKRISRKDGYVPSNYVLVPLFSIDVVLVFVFLTINQVGSNIFLTINNKIEGEYFLVSCVIFSSINKPLAIAQDTTPLF